ncbi:WapI family immunity protein [Microbulbifer sp. PAAF003]|uniref:WapI family immunity protein n=1 Tax=Microbulbifer sp. PAAF003 TaxID=3243375 RepID=UPI00403A5AB5
MQIKLNDSEEIQIQLLSRGASNYIYDCNLLVSFRTGEKTYSQEVWVDGTEFKCFLNELEILNHKLSGKAELASETPGELLIKFTSVDSLGHMALHFELGKQIWIGPEVFWSKIIQAFPIDAEYLERICKEMFKSFSEVKNA